MSRVTVDHSRCDHPTTAKGRRLCREARDVKCLRDIRRLGLDTLKEPEDPSAKRRFKRDLKVWKEEEVEYGPIVLPDLRDPRVRTEVRRKAADADVVLHIRLMTAGLHVSQTGSRPS